MVALQGPAGVRLVEGPDSPALPHHYIRASGMRLVRPYHFDFVCNVKLRWHGMHILDVFSQVWACPTHSKTHRYSLRCALCWSRTHAHGWLVRKGMAAHAHWVMVRPVSAGVPCEVARLLRARAGRRAAAGGGRPGVPPPGGPRRPPAPGPDDAPLHPPPRAAGPGPAHLGVRAQP